MTVKLGDIALTRLQVVEVDEPRHLVELRAPGATGSVFQDLGRGAVRLTLAGVFLGEHALRDIEVLRRAHSDASPMSFSADIAVGSEITDVVIEQFEVHQVPGHTFRYEYRLRVGEWTEPARSAVDDVAPVDAQIASEAGRWTAQSQRLAAGLTNPAALATTLAADPSLLGRIDTSELAQAVLGALGGLDATDFTHLLASISNVDPQRVVALIEALHEADSLEDLLQLVSDDGIDLLEQLTGIDLSQASSVVRAFLGGIDFIDKIRAVIGAASSLLDALVELDPAATLEQLEQGSTA